MTIDLNTALVFATGAAVSLIVFKAVSAVREWAYMLRKDLMAVSDLALKLDVLIARVDAEVDVMQKVASDNDLAATSIAKSAVQLNLLLEDIKQIMMPEQPIQPSDPQSFMTLQTSFEKIEKDLLEQGIDPETAKYKAAEYELDRLSEGDLTEISMSL